MALNPIFKQQALLANNGKVKVRKNFAKWLYPHNAQRTYEKELVALNKQLSRIALQNVIDLLPSLVEEAKVERGDNSELKLDLGLVDSIKEITKATLFDYNSFVSDPTLNELTGQQAARISNYNKGQLVKVIHSAVKVNPIMAEPYLRPQIELFQAQNSALIKKLSAEQATRMEGTLFRNLSAGNGVKVIREELQKNFEISENRARLIARDQTNKFNGDLAQLRQQELGIGEYWWSGSLDERERQTHLDNEGKHFAWNKPSLITGHPGSQIRCRCTAQPILTDEMFL
jgi:SPP1 gp7 family putative phage head morphogenesis protein